MQLESSPAGHQAPARCVYAIIGVHALVLRQQIHLGVGDDQAVGEQLREIAHDPFAGPRMLLAKALEIAPAALRGR